MPVLLEYRGNPAATLVDRAVLAMLAAADARGDGSVSRPLPAAQRHRPDWVRLRRRDDATRAVIRPIGNAAEDVRQGGDNPAVRHRIAAPSRRSAKREDSDRPDLESHSLWLPRTHIGRRQDRRGRSGYRAARDRLAPLSGSHWSFEAW